jgi:hypothetical protein
MPSNRRESGKAAWRRTIDVNLVGANNSEVGPRRGGDERGGAAAGGCVVPAYL